MNFTEIATDFLVQLRVSFCFGTAWAWTIQPPMGIELLHLSISIIGALITRQGLHLVDVLFLLGIG